MNGRSCEYCDGAKALVIGDTDDQGIAIKYPDYLIAYGYHVHDYGPNAIHTRINYCPMCGRKFKNRKE